MSVPENTDPNSPDNLGADSSENPAMPASFAPELFSEMTSGLASSGTPLTNPGDTLPDLNFSLPARVDMILFKLSAENRTRLARASKAAGLLCFALLGAQMVRRFGGGQDVTSLPPQALVREAALLGAGLGFATVANRTARLKN